MFALGVCTYFMAFTCFPYKSIEKTDSGKYNYVLDLSNLENLLKEKKKCSLLVNTECVWNRFFIQTA